MTDIHPSQSTVRRQRTSTKNRVAAAENRLRPGRGNAPALELGASPVAVQVQIGDRWIAGQALTGRVGPAGRDEVLVSHHGHLVWVDRQEIRVG